jgi:hypothetical protein
VTGFSEARRRLGDDRVLAGFPSVYGVRERQVVRYADSPREGKGSFNTLLIGEVGEPNNRAVRDLRRSCARAGIKVRRSTRMQDYLLTRAALNIPLILGLYGHGHKTAELAADRKRMRLVIRARRELVTVLRAAGVRITPCRCRLKLLLPEGLLVARLKRFLERSFAEIAFAAHTGEARRESASLYRGLQQTAERFQRETPAFEELYQSASRSGSRRR